MTDFARDRSRWSNAQTAFSRTPTCRVQTDCDGANLAGPGPLATGVCGACKRGAARRARKVHLRGGPEVEE